LRNPKQSNDTTPSSKGQGVKRCVVACKMNVVPFSQINRPPSVPAHLVFVEHLFFFIIMNDLPF
jgi:hypothetical protein